MKYMHIMRAAAQTPWAILPEKAEQIMAFLAFKAHGGELSEADIQAVTAGTPRPRATTPGTVAVLPIFGVIAHRAHMVGGISSPGGTSTEMFSQVFRAVVNDPNVKAIVLDVDSPGGTVEGVEELATEIFEARDKKKIIAVANAMAASAAYWVASGATELVVTPSGSVGSIGVIAVHEDISKALDTEGVKLTMIRAGKYKYEGSPYEPLTEEAREAIQADVDSYYLKFAKTVARNRGVGLDAVTEGFGQGRMVLAAEAVKQGMADRVATLDQVLDKLGVGRPVKSNSLKTAAERELHLI